MKSTKLDKEIREGLYDPTVKSLLHTAIDKMLDPIRKGSIEDRINRGHWKCDKCGGTTIIQDKGLGLECKTCKHKEDIDELESRFSKFSWLAAAYDPKPSALPPIRWYEAMVMGIKKSSDVRNPYAIVKSIWAKLSPSKRADIKAREAKGERFRYDLPLPVDKPTRGTGTVRMVKSFKLAEVQVNLSVRDYLAARMSGLFSPMKRQDGTTALVARCKSPQKNVNVFVDRR